MNCPMCGAPLSPNDYECPKCYTKRSDMGLSYNNNGAYGANNAGYGGYNQNYGNNGNYSGLNNNSAMARADRNSKRTIGWVIAVAVIILIAVFMCFIRPNLYKKFDMGNFTVELPMDCRDKIPKNLNLGEMNEAKCFSDNKMDFYFARVSAEDFGESSELPKFKDEIISVLDDGFKDSVPGYRKISETDDMIEFNYLVYGSDGSSDHYAKTKMLYKGTDVYMVSLSCKAKDQAKMAPKFSRILESIKFK